MGSRKQQAHYSVGISKIALQTTYLEERVSALSGKLARLNEEIAQAEVTAKEPSETMLSLQSAQNTLSNEYNRFKQIELKSRRLVKGKNKESVRLLDHEIKELENQSVPLAEKQLDITLQRNNDLKKGNDNYFLALAKLHADFLAVLNFVNSEIEQSSAALTSLSQKDKDLAKYLAEDLAGQEQELLDRSRLLDEEIGAKQADVKALHVELEKLESTMKYIDSLEDPKAYIDEVALKLEEDKLSLEAKQDVLATVQHINAEVEEINSKLENGINDYGSIMTEFEETLNKLSASQT